MILKSFSKWMTHNAELFSQVDQYNSDNGETQLVKVSKGTFRTYFYERRSNELYRGGALKTEQLKATVTGVFIFNVKDLSGRGVTISDSDRISFEGKDYSVIHGNNVGRWNEVYEVFVRGITGG